MRKTLIRSVSFLALAALMSACAGEDSTLVCGESIVIDSFPREITVDEVQQFVPAMDLEGVVSVKGIDSLLIGITSGRGAEYCSIYSLNSGKKLAPLFKIGEGPGEFSQMPSFSAIYGIGDSLYADAYYKPKHQYLTLNLSATVATGHEVYSRIATMEKAKYADVIRPLADGDTLIMSTDLNSGTRHRKIISPSSISPIANIGNLEADFHTDDLNTLSGAITAAYDNGTKVAEAMTRMNQINLYSHADTTFRKTICVGSGLDRIGDVDSRSKESKIRTYGGMVDHKGYLVVLHHGITEKDYRDNTGQSELHIFDFDGNPYARVKLPLIAVAFFIDRNDRLYLFNNLDESEYLYSVYMKDLFDNRNI